MKNTKDAIWADYEDAKHQIKQTEVGSDVYDYAVTERERTRNGLLEIARIEADLEKEKSRLESEAKKEKNRNIVGLLTFAGTAILSGAAIYQTFKFDKTSTVTSSAGHDIIRSFIPKLWKR